MTLLREFFRLEAAGGILLVIAAIVALIMENSPISGVNDMILNTPVAIQFGELILKKPLLLWINDGLMAIFFLLVGLEIKREILQGHLSSREQITLPAVAAIGGVMAPAIIYYMLNKDNPAALSGWAIPTATDIAFALGVVQLLGNRVPAGLKVTLVTIAIIDDLIAIAVIALFYTAHLHIELLLGAMVMMVILAVLNAMNVMKLTPYMLVGLVMWVLVLKSGVHATLAGVAVAMFIPLRGQNKRGDSPAIYLEHALHPWVAYMVLPVFAFANAAVPLGGISFEMFMEPVTLGIILGLFFGKQIGIMGITLIGRMIGLVQLPQNTTWMQYYAMSIVCGIGFTMSLFIGALAFDGIEQSNAVRLGVLTASLIATIFGYTAMRITCPKQPMELNTEPH